MNQVEFQRRWYELESLLFGFAMKLTRNKEEAKDLMQETVLKAYRNRDRFRINTNFKAWTTTIMRNTFINAYRKKNNS
jgi:RNA polymerase sigma-70 factor (ECF subfamily)